MLTAGYTVGGQDLLEAEFLSDLRVNRFPYG